MNLEGIALSELSQALKASSSGFHFYKFPGVIGLVETEGRMVAAGCGEG